ncbi:hypothetical protein HDU86_004369 [Geranomyces michiganensis]|nr:hypothetical protein HDU86_004369 [Geranomyces michiganensis]
MLMADSPLLPKRDARSKPSPTGCLPQDLILEVLQYVGPSDTVRWTQCSSVWRGVCSDNLLWKHYSLERWHHWANGVPYDPTFTGWRNLFEERYRKDSLAARALNGVVLEPRHRLSRMLSIAKLREDALDLLDRNLEDCPEDYLARKFHVEQVKSLINRRWVIGQWLALVPQLHGSKFDTIPSLAQLRPSCDEDFSLEFGAFLSCKFVDRHVQYADIVAQLDALAAEAATVVEPPDCRHPGRIIERRARQLYDFLFVRKQFAAAVDAYYDVRNSLIDQVLSRRLGIPISLCLIFAVVGRRLGIKIELTNFPHHVLARLVTENGDEWYVDCFRHRPVPDDGFKTREQCIAILHSYGVGQRLEFLEPVPKTVIFVRMATNIITNVNHMRDPHGSLNLQHHAYGGMSLLLLLSPVAQMQPVSPWRRFLYGILVSEFPEDVWFAEADQQLLGSQLASGADPAGAARKKADLELLTNEIANIWKEDGAIRTPVVKDRETMANKPVMKTGDLMRHRKYDYYGAVYGWDAKYSGGDDWWASQAGTDTLVRGRNQPFYSVVSIDTRHNNSHSETSHILRYVAEENMGRITEPTEVDEARRLIEACPHAGRWFKRWDQDAGRFETVGEITAEFVNG